MIDQDLEELLEIAAQSVVVAPAPTDAVVRAAHKRKAWPVWTLVGLSSVAAAALVIGVASLNPGTKAPVVEQPPLQPTPSVDTRLVGIGQVFVSVPEGWGTNQTHCGTPQRDTVVLDAAAVELCIAPRPQGIDSVSLIRGRPFDFGAAQTVQIDGVTAEAEPITCHEQYGRDFEVCSRSVYFPAQDVTVTAESSSARTTFLDDFLQNLHVFVDSVAVPGFMDVNNAKQEKAGDRYLQLLDEAGLVADVHIITDSRWPDGFVLAVDPGVGALVHPGDQVTVDIAGSR